MRTFLLLAALVSASLSCIAQNAPLACDGRMATVRVSEIKSGGTAEGFQAAVAAHKAWYAAHNLAADQIFAARVVVRDEKTHAASYSDKHFMTFHIHATVPGSAPGPKHDEAYDQFVKLYRDNSEIKSEYAICMPNSAQ